MTAGQQQSLDQKLILKDLLDTDLLRDFLEKFSGFCGLRIRLLDENGNVFLSHRDIPRFCAMVKAGEKNRIMCEEAKGECGWMPVTPGEASIYNCFCGLLYAVVPLASEFDITGRAVLGPFRNKNTSISVTTQDTDILKSQLHHALDRIPIRETAETKRVSRFFADMMDIFLFLSAKRLLTSRVHLETIYRARDEIFNEMENQMIGKEDREELDRLKQIF